MFVTAGLALLVAASGVSGLQIGYLWTFEELIAKADLVVIAEPESSRETGRRMEHPELTPDLPVVERITAFKVLGVLKPEAGAGSSAAAVRLRHYQLDRAEWQRRHPALPGMPPPGVVNAGTALDFSRNAGPYILFLRRSESELYEPLSGHMFPTHSVYSLRSVLKPGG